MYLRRLGTVLSQTVNAWIADRAQSMGAALSYYTVFSLAPATKTFCDMGSLPDKGFATGGC